MSSPNPSPHNPTSLAPATMILHSATADAASLQPPGAGPLGPRSSSAFTSAGDLQPSLRKKVLIIFTGGTIGMARSQEGFLCPQKGFVHRVLSTFGEMSHHDMPLFDVLEWDEPLDSSDFSSTQWIALAQQLEANYYHYDGFVVLCGTDTLAYTGSILSFLLENLSKTVVLTGSMIPLDDPVSDAKRNLLVSMMVAAHLNVCECLIYFNTQLLRANRTTKTDPWSIQAFASPCAEPIATMGVGIHVNTKMLLRPPSRRFQIHTTVFTKIVVLTVTPVFSYTSLRSIATGWQNDTDPEPPAIVLLLYGSGNAPIRHPEWNSSLQLCLDHNCPVVVLSQCFHSSTSLDTYEGGSHMKKLGVIDGKDMTVEACVAKLSYLIGLNLRKGALKAAMETNLRGELSQKDSISYSGYSLGSADSNVIPARL